MSLCYSIGSSYYGAKGILTVGAGIDFDKERLTRDEILRQLDACRRGEITQEELTAGKEPCSAPFVPPPTPPAPLRATTPPRT